MRSELAEQAEENVENGPVFPAMEEVLASGLDRFDAFSIKNIGAVRESALRRSNGDRAGTQRH